MGLFLPCQGVGQGVTFDGWMTHSNARWWERWLESYWTHRLDGVPKPLDDGEIGVMIGWLPVLNSLFSTAVELAVGMRSVPISTNQTICDLWRGGHGRDSPEAVAKLLIHLGEHASLDPAWNRGRELIVTLLSSDNLLDGLRTPLLELAAGLGPA